MTEVAICICTFRRASVLETLASVMELEVPGGITLDVVVVDNDSEPSAQTAIETFATKAKHPVRYVHRPACNISIARNGALDAAGARFLAFLDDDEVATPDWLAALLRRQSETGADVVLGPVAARYPDDAPRWMREALPHATEPVWTDGGIRTGYSGNVLIDRASPALADLRFDFSLGRAGGEDSVFFSAAHAAGAAITFAPDALVIEPVPPSRLSLGWLARRKYRMGQTHAKLLMMAPGHGRWRLVPLAMAKAGYCLVSTLIGLPLDRRRNTCMLRFFLHAGVISGLVTGAGQAKAAVE